MAAIIKTEKRLVHVVASPKVADFYTKLRHRFLQ